MENQDIEPWQCCSIKNKHEIRYFIQCAFGLITICFCMIMIVRNKGDITVWVSLLSSTVGLFFPQPSMTH